MSEPSPTGSKRWIQLDVLRGLAILLVLFYHCPLHGTDLGVMGPVLSPVIAFGWAGVPMFFVLSGFLVGGLLFKEIRATGTANVWRFLVRRAFKIWPAYFVFIGYYVVKLLHRKEPIRQVFLELWPNLLQIQNYIPTPPHHLWSIAVEEHFYLAFALFMALLISGGNAVRRLKVIPWITLALVIACLGLRLLNWNKPFENYSHMWRTHLCVDALFLGVFVGYIYHFHPRIFERWTAHRGWLFAFAFAANLPMFLMMKTDRFVFTFGLTLLALGDAALVAAVAPAPASREPAAPFWNFPFVRLVGWIGIYSYSIYLWQEDLATQPLITSLPVLWHYGSHTVQASLFLTLHFTGSVLAGVIMAKLIEFPALHLRERLIPSGSRSTAVPVAAAVSAAQPGSLPATGI
jgi:peptidoglycan/LPS O-acetylase OafA/YrhL